MTKPIVFFGTEDFSLASLEALVAHDFNVGAVVTKPDMKKGRGHKLTQPAVKIFAEQHDIPVLQPQKLTDITSFVSTLDLPIGVLVSYGKIIPQSILDLFTPGIVNVHPSLLPRYRGPSPIESAIVNRDDKTGVTIMQLEAKMDAGPIYSQITYPLDGHETQAQLYDTLAQRGADELVRVLPDIISDELQPTVQDEAAATYSRLLDRTQSLISPAQYTAADLEAKIRAHLEFPRSKYDIHGHLITILSAHIVDEPKNALALECADGKFVQVDELIAPSGKRMDSDSFLRGYAA